MCANEEASRVATADDEAEVEMKESREKVRKREPVNRFAYDVIGDEEMYYSAGKSKVKEF